MSDYQSISVYSNLALVFVEDEITKAYLNEIYRPNLALIRIENAGNLQNVRSLVDYHKDKQPCFGIVDRDYRWSKASKQGNIYMLSKHEIENYMLDAESIAQSTFNAKKRLSPDRISKRIDDFLEAKRMWFTCCYILAELNIRINQGFPHNPKLSEIQDSAAIVRYLAESKFDKRLDEVVQSINPSQINQLVNSAVQDIERIYVKGEQLAFFPGKEVYRYIRGEVLGSNYGSRQSMDIDLAKDIGAIQLRNQRVPKELISIRNKITGIVKS